MSALGAKKGEKQGKDGKTQNRISKNSNSNRYLQALEKAYEVNEKRIQYLEREVRRLSDELSSEARSPQCEVVEKSPSKGGQIPLSLQNS